MELILEVTSDEKHLMGEHARRTFQAAGGLIGRDPACDWVIPDEKRHLSARHAIVSYEEGAFHLTDISTNGVFINGDEKPLGKSQTIRLNDADRLSMGNIEFVARLQLDPAANPYAQQSAMQSPEVNPLRPTPGGLKKSLDPLAVFRASHGLTESKPPSERQSTHFSGAEQVVSAPDHRPAAHRAYKAPSMLPEDWLVEPEQRLEPANHAEPVATVLPVNPQKAPVSSTQLYDNSAREAPLQRAATLVQAFCRGLGIEPQTLDCGDAEHAMEEMGAALKANLEGMVALMQQRAKLKNEFRMDMTLVQTNDNNPLKFAVDGQQVLKQFFTPQSGSFLPVSQAFAACYKDTQVHQLAMLAAVQASLQDMFAMLSPKRIEEKLSRDRTGMSVSSRSSRCWRKYQSLYEELVTEDDEFHRVFGAAFVRAYDVKANELKTAMRREESE